MTLLLLSAVLCLGTALGMAFILPSSPEPASGIASCKEQLLQDAKEMLLVALNLEHEPHMKLQGMSQFRAAWKTGLKAISPNSNHSSEAQSPGSVSAATENETQTTTGHRCCQITSQISITDLGWDSWIIYPENFTYTECVACTHDGGKTWQHCRVETPSSKLHLPEVKCCSAVEEVWLPFVYIGDNSSLVTSNVPLTQKCGCQPEHHADLK
ncbi:dauer larva development regulatory growth factor daf-7-like [Acipenser oxyrinchus oxyrinchus]|uniref:Dauer larva development regulatory growth factor daf-7-like n=1 Tax=Acipenser oxyrinchus oxyrinchus TaxID=40147 RepID=A0AAD8CI54_ACIOX|nr:dauer larva development regulatory growth factor daf-7-like [Acipenser oxyrinchus oxyrinchus]